MKKIVALVLSLVMVLGLSTVAFADTTTTTIKATEGYAIYNVTDNTQKLEKVEITKVVTDKQVVTEGATVTTYYTPVFYMADVHTFIEVDATAASHKLVKNGAIVAYLYAIGGNVPTTSDVVSSYVKAVDEPSCAEFDKATYAAGVYMIDGVPYAAAGANWAVYNGKFVNYGDVAVAETHDYEANTYSTSVVNGVDTVKCTVCKKVFDVLTAAEVATMAPAAYVVDAEFGFIATGVATAPEAGDKVESAQTFDAGIAMYVGMSVMAAAGSAVVLKKKD